MTLDVALVQAQVHAARRHEVDVAQHPLVEHPLDGVDRPGSTRTCARTSARVRRARASRSSSSARAAEVASGFSTNVCLPASRLRVHSSKWVKTGVAIDDGVHLGVGEHVFDRVVVRTPG